MGKSAHKKSFLIHTDSLEILDDLTDEQAGKLFKAIKDYQSGKEPKLSQLIKIAFSPFKNYFERDKEKWDYEIEKRREAGRLGAEARWGKSEDGKGSQGIAKDGKGIAKMASAKSANSKMANIADNVSVSVNDSVSESVNVSERKKSNKGKPLFNVQTFIDEGYKQETLEALIEHRKIVVKKPILTDRMMRGLLKALTEYYNHWQITPDEAIDFYLSKQWVSIDKEYKYPHRPMKQNKATDSLSYSDIGKMLKDRKGSPTTDNKILNLTKKMGV